MALPTDQQPSQVGTYEKILTIANRIMHGGEITKEEAIELIHTSDDDTMILLAMADKIRQHFNDNSV
ncbi:MAG: biotin synthase BioB, partial [Veillonella sp.]|nr:biotin synthase BioB [Veillonella sp.]